MDKEEEVFKQDFSGATLDDHFDKTVLPKVPILLFECTWSYLKVPKTIVYRNLGRAHKQPLYLAYGKKTSMHYYPILFHEVKPYCRPNDK